MRVATWRGVLSSLSFRLRCPPVLQQLHGIQVPSPAGPVHSSTVQPVPEVNGGPTVQQLLQDVHVSLQRGAVQGCTVELITRVWGTTICQKLLNDTDLALHGGSQEVLRLHGTLNLLGL